ncbi:MAG: hypothetical protein JWP70_1305 [Leifsonia sp.]|jgi:hypothetical protein|nr:hypothetical protein [Leifsonia sp.]MDQ1588207.1 hypothetical protein [Microbacteriaceae bacterium]
MPRWRHWAASAHEERGSASLEFITIGLVMLVPLVYLVLAVASIQAAALATEGAARQAARVYVQAASEAEATARAGRAIEFALADYGLAVSDAEVRVSCTPNPSACLTRRGAVTVTILVRAALPLVPNVLDLSAAASVPIEATATQRVSRFWGSG